MSLRTRYVLFAISATGLTALLLWGLAGLPDFGRFGGSYGVTLNDVAVAQRHATNVVAAIVWDYRALDTMGEELILFASVMATSLLLREAREREADQSEDAVHGETIRAVELALVGILVVVGLYTVAHGIVTPGGGFQGGVVLASGLIVVYLAGSYRTYRRVGPTALVDFGEGVGVGGYVGIGLAGMAFGAAFLANFLPLGTKATLASAGTITALNVASGLAVAAAFVLLVMEFLQELMVMRLEEAEK